MISPLLANIILHYVLDEWFEKEVCPRLKGKAFLIRYADDFVIGVAREDDARRILEVLPKRMSKYGLTVHPEKTRAWYGSNRAQTTTPPLREGATPNQGHSTFWDSPTTGVDLCKAYGWSNVRRQKADSVAPYKRYGSGAGPTGITQGLRTTFSCVFGDCSKDTGLSHHAALALCRVLVVWARPWACCSRSRSSANRPSIARCVRTRYTVFCILR